MAQIKLIFKPDFSEVSKGIKGLKAEIENSIGKIHIKIDSGAQQATQALAANLQNATRGADALASSMGEVTKKIMTFGAGGPIKRVTEYTDALGRVTRVIEDIGEESTNVTKTVTNNIQAQERKAQKQAEEFIKLKRQVFREYRKWDEEDAKEAEKLREMELQAERQLAKEMEELRERQKATWTQFTGEQEKYEAEQAAEAHRKNAEAIVFEAQSQAQARKEKEKAAEAAVSLEKQYSNLIRQIENLKAQYPAGTFDEIERQAVEARDALRNLDKSSEDYASRVKELQGTYKGLQRDMANTRSETQKLDKITESFWMNIQKFARWYIGGNFVVKIVNSLREALNVMKEVDTELANIQKVTDRTDAEMQKLADSAYRVASAYGVSAEQYLESAAEFAKAGFGDQAEQLAEVAIKTQLVGDVSAEVADKFLIASNAAWKMNGNIQALNKTLDAANTIENNYATSIEKLAAGMPIAASVAANAGMTFEETIAALGTITSVTQETGTKAATALRALILNIIGAVGEYEDGIEVTEESVKSLNGILEVYAKDALAAAKAAGTVINPMEAIAALAKASEEGLVNQAELFEILSNLGGKLRTNQLISLVQNYGMYLEMLDKTTESAGSADKEIGIMLDTWTAKTNILKNSWVEFVNKTIDSDFIKFFIDAGTSAIRFADNAGLAALALGGLYTLFKGKQIIDGFRDAIDDLSKSLQGLNGGFTAVTSWIGIAMTAISAAIMLYKRLDRAREESVSKAAEEAEAYRESIDKYDELIGKIADEKTGRDELLEAIAKTDSAYSDEAKQIKNLNDLRETAIKLTKEQAKAEAQAYIDSNTAGYLTAKRVLGNEGVKLSSYQAAVDSYTAQYQREGKLNWFDQWQLNEAQKYIDKYSERVENAREVVEQYETAQAILNDEYDYTAEKAEGAANATDELTGSQRKAAVTTEELSERMHAVSNDATAMDTAIAGVVDAMDDFGAGSVEVYDAMKALEAAIPGSTKELYDFTNGALLADEALFEDKESVLDLIDAMRQVDFSDAINEAERAAAAAWDMAEAWTAVLPMMGGVFANAAMASSAYAGSLQSQRSQWNARVTALRQRADYRPKESGTGSGFGSTSDAELERLKDVVSLRKAELDFLEASGKSEEEINAKRKEIQAALHDQAEYMRSIGASEADILALSTEWWKIQKDITGETEDTLKLQQEMFDTLKGIVDDYYDTLLSDKEKELSLEEKLLAVQKAEADLANAQKERTVRYFNAATGQWEWAANSKNVKSAQDALKKAQDDLNKYQREQAWKEFKSAWEYVAEQIKAGAITFAEAYNYMYDAMKAIQDKYGVDLSMTLEDSIGGFRTLNYGIDGLTQEVTNSLGASVGLLNEKLKDFQTAIDAMQDAFEEVGEKVRRGEITIEDAYLYLKNRAREISDRFGIDMTGAIETALAGFDKTNGSIEDLWKQVVITLMKANSVNWYTASDSEKQYLHAQNEYLGKLIGAEYDSSGYWSLNGKRLYDPRDEKGNAVTAAGAASGKSGSGSASTTGGKSGKDTRSIWKEFAAAAAKNPDAVNWEAMREAHDEYGSGVYDEYMASGPYDKGGILKGIGGIKATKRDEFILSPELTKKLLDPTNNDLSRRATARMEQYFDVISRPTPIGPEIGTQNIGDTYTMNGVTIGEEKAKTTTVYELARLARTLSIVGEGS